MGLATLSVGIVSTFAVLGKLGHMILNRTRNKNVLKPEEVDNTQNAVPAPDSTPDSTTHYVSSQLGIKKDMEVQVEQESQEINEEPRVDAEKNDGIRCM